MGKISKNTKAVVINGDNSGVVNLLNINMNILIQDKEEAAKEKILDVVKDIIDTKAITKENYRCFWRYLLIMLSNNEEKKLTYFIRFFRILIITDYKLRYFMFKSSYLSYIEKKEIIDTAFDNIFNVISKDDLKIPKEFVELIKDEILKFEAAKSVCEDVVKYAAQHKSIDETTGINYDENFYRTRMDYNKKMVDCFEILFTENYGGSFPDWFFNHMVPRPAYEVA